MLFIVNTLVINPQISYQKNNLLILFNFKIHLGIELFIMSKTYSVRIC